VVSLARWLLYAYRLTKELLEVLCNAIRGYKLLLKDGKILHRDISKNNIIITEAASKGELIERLINLDLVKELDSVLSRASHYIGTM
jgi:serine/threonine protein kinase